VSAYHYLSHLCDGVVTRRRELAAYLQMDTEPVATSPSQPGPQAKRPCIRYAAARAASTNARMAASTPLKHPEFCGGSRTRCRPGGRRCSVDGSPEEVSVGLA
jgi:hypothetical protein